MDIGHVFITAKRLRSGRLAPAYQCKVNINFYSSWFFNQQVGLMFAFMGEFQQQKIPMQPAWM